MERVRHQSLTHTHTLPPTPTLTAHQFPLFVYILPYLILLPYYTSSIPLPSSKKNIMGRPLFSTILSQQAPVEPIIHVAEPEHAVPICERWSISNSFDPDSDEFFAPGNTVYEAFLTEEEIAARERDNSTQVQQQQQQESSLQLPPPPPQVQQPRTIPQQPLEGIIPPIDPNDASRRDIRRRLRDELRHSMRRTLYENTVPRIRTSPTPAPPSNQPSTQTQNQNASPTGPLRTRLVQIGTTVARQRESDLLLPQLSASLSDSASDDSDWTSDATLSGRASPLSPAPLSAVSATGRLRRQIPAAAANLIPPSGDGDGDEFSSMPPLVTPSNEWLLLAGRRPLWNDDLASSARVRRVVAGQ